METTMNARKLGIFGLAALGLALTAPVQAAPDFMDGAFIVAQRDRADDVRQDRREARKDEYPEGHKRRPTKHEAEREEPHGHGYGYGYERRQKQRFEEDDRSRGRR
jgi:hypothetical protein